MITKDSEGIILSLYDPLGYEGDNISDRFLDIFASSLAEKYDGQVVVKNRIIYLVPRGYNNFQVTKKVIALYSLSLVDSYNN